VKDLFQLGMNLALYRVGIPEGKIVVAAKTKI
jgi:hypothetical protein